MLCDQGGCGPTAGLFLGSLASHTSAQDDVTANQVSMLVADGVGGFFEVSAVGMSFHGLNRPHRSLDSERNRPYLGPTDIGMPEEWCAVKGAFLGVWCWLRRGEVNGGEGTVVAVVGGCGRRHLVPAGAGCIDAGVCRGHAFAIAAGDRSSEGGMVLFGLGQSWAQSHESATPTVGGHADTELAVI
jgi:hypothetical protein